MIILSVIVQIPIIVAAIKVMGILPRLGWVMLAFTLPPAVLLLVGGLGLARDRIFGYYFIYLAILFSGVGGLKVAIIPELKMILKGGFYADDISLLTNLALLALLVYFHLRRLDKTSLTGRGHMAAICCLLFVGALSVGIGRSLVDKERGRAERVGDIPYVQLALPNLKVTDRIAYYAVYNRLQKGLSAVVSGKTTEDAVLELAAEHNLIAVPPEKRHKLLPQAKQWKLSSSDFPTRFDAEDHCFMGRVKGHPRLTVQVGFRRANQRFTVQLFGFVATN
jgi:hypothetical protein